MMTVVFTQSIGFGLNGAQDTLVAQAFGKGQDHMCGVYLNRARVVNTAFFVPMCLVFFLTEELMLATGQDPKAATAAEQYVILMLPGVFFHLQRHCTTKFLQAQGVFRP